MMRSRTVLRLRPELRARGEQALIRRDLCGMTLIELLVAVTLLSGLMASVGNLLISSLRAQMGWDASVASTRRVERAQRQLEADLVWAKRFFAHPATGDEHRLGLMRVLPWIEGGEPPVPRWVNVVYRLDAGEQGLRLMRDVTLWDGQEPAGEPQLSEPLLELAQATLAFGMRDPDGQLVWSPTWDGRVHGVPRLVKLEGRFAVAPGQPSAGISCVIRNPAGNLPLLEEASE